jgi:hypothetical protein
VISILWKGFWRGESQWSDTEKAKQRHCLFETILGKEFSSSDSVDWTSVKWCGPFEAHCDVCTLTWWYLEMQWFASSELVDLSLYDLSRQAKRNNQTWREGKRLTLNEFKCEMGGTWLDGFPYVLSTQYFIYSPFQFPPLRFKWKHFAIICVNCLCV